MSLMAVSRNTLIMPGWQDSTMGVTDFDALPENARNYINKVESLAGVPIDIISTGPDRC